MIRPRPYLSFSQMTTFEMSKDTFVRSYVYNEKRRISRNMSYGSTVADSLKVGEATGDPVLDLMIARIPKFERMDKPVVDPKGVEIVNPHDGKKYKVPVLENGDDPIPLLAVPDTATRSYTAFKEYKTSVRRWTQRMADESGQITFYCAAIWVLKGKIPKDIELVNVELKYTLDGRLLPTGDLYRYKTQRTTVDIIKMTKRMRNAWSGIKDLCHSELL